VHLRHWQPLLLLLELLLVSLPASSSAREYPTRNKGTITIMADPSITVPLTLIARQFSYEKHMPVSVEFASTKEQIEKIEQGAEANVLISAKPLWIKRMQQGGLIDVYSRTNIAANQLVIIGPLGSQSSQTATEGTQLLKLLPIKKPDFQFGIGDPEYLAEGTYSLESVGMLDIEEDLEPHYTIFRSMSELSKSVANYNLYGMMYASDTLLYPRISKVMTLPESSHSPIIYQAVVVAGEYMNEAREFLKYLKQPKAQNYFKQAGFYSVKDDSPEHPNTAM
jgi:molybdate transport system substrate-binding protein